MSQTRPLLSHIQQISLLQKRLSIAEEGWRYSENTLHTLIEQIKTIDFSKEGVATSFQNTIMELFPDQDVEDNREDTESDTDSD